MTPPEFKPLPSFGGTPEERLARSPHAQKALEAAQKAREDEERQEAEKAALRARKREEMGVTLTEAQIKAWRIALHGTVGPIAYFMSDRDIQEIRDNLQMRIGN